MQSSSANFDKQLQARSVIKALEMSTAQQQNTVIYAQALSLMARNYVGAIDFNQDKEAVQKFFEPYGRVKSVGMSFDPVTKHHKGYAFIEFEAAEATFLAEAQLNGVMFAGRALKVGRPAITAQVQAIMNAIKEESKKFNRIYVASIPLHLAERDLRQVFEPFGQIIDCELPPDLTTSKAKHKGYGFIQYADADSAIRAVAAMNMFLLVDQYLRVGHAVTPPSKVPVAAVAAAAVVSAKINEMDAKRESLAARISAHNSSIKGLSAAEVMFGLGQSSGPDIGMAMPGLTPKDFLPKPTVVIPQKLYSTPTPAASANAFVAPYSSEPLRRDQILPLAPAWGDVDRKPPANDSWGDYSQAAGYAPVRYSGLAGGVEDMARDSHSSGSSSEDESAADRKRESASNYDDYSAAKRTRPSSDLKPAWQAPGAIGPGPPGPPPETKAKQSIADQLLSRFLGQSAPASISMPAPKDTTAIPLPTEYTAPKKGVFEYGNFRPLEATKPPEAKSSWQPLQASSAAGPKMGSDYADVKRVEHQQPPASNEPWKMPPFSIPPPVLAAFKPQQQQQTTKAPWELPPFAPGPNPTATSSQPPPFGEYARPPGVGQQQQRQQMPSFSASQFNQQGQPSFPSPQQQQQQGQSGSSAPKPDDPLASLLGYLQGGQPLSSLSLPASQTEPSSQQSYPGGAGYSGQRAGPPAGAEPTLNEDNAAQLLRMLLEERQRVAQQEEFINRLAKRVEEKSGNKPY